MIFTEKQVVFDLESVTASAFQESKPRTTAVLSLWAIQIIAQRLLSLLVVIVVF